jgi:23S rRNA (guanosine2251-2'-O)-methyltransferase
VKPPRRPPASPGPPPARANRHSHAPGPVPQVSEPDLYDLLVTAEAPLLLILDEVTDPHNLGACLRSANAAGALAVVTPRHHSASVTETVQRVSCGAASVTPVVQVTNLARAMKKFQELGLWLVGTDDSATRSLHETDLRGPLGLVLGAEGSGMRRLTREGCDFLVRIPMLGTVPCLNVSVAAGVCLFEAVRQRLPPAPDSGGRV